MKRDLWQTMTAVIAMWAGCAEPGPDDLDPDTLTSSDQEIAITRWGSSGPPTGSTPYFLLNFRAAGDGGQCWNTGAAGARAGDFTPDITLDTDRRGGGCEQQFALYDPAAQLSGLALSVDFGAHPGSDASQCWTNRTDGRNYHENLPLVSTYRADWTTWSPVFGIDTDRRGGWCDQTFAISGRDDVALEIQFTATGDPGQCFNTGTNFAVRGRPVTLGINTDDRVGGCRQQFRLRLGADIDQDGRSNVTDNCPGSYNPGQADCDGDGLGDVCDPSLEWRLVDSSEFCDTYPDGPGLCITECYRTDYYQQDCTGATKQVGPYFVGGEQAPC